VRPPPERPAHPAGGSPAGPAAGLPGPPGLVPELLPLGFLVGEWTGEGHSHGAPVRGRLQVRLTLGGSFLESRERLYDADGGLDFEDRAFYRWHAGDTALKVLHLQAPGWTQESHVELIEGGIRWNTGPFNPRVLLLRDGPGRLRAEVRVPWHQEPDTVILWTRAGGA